MKFTYNWLKEYLPELDIPPEKLAKILTMSGIIVSPLEEFDEDIIFDVETTSNRPDLLSVLGIAREVSILVDTKFQMPHLWFSETEKDIKDLIDVKVTCPNLCPRYTARAVVDVKISEAPLWMQKRLLAVGLRPINNVVDITNYVLFECGQPLHAFDKRFLTGARIIVRESYPGEKILAIDEKEYDLPENTCVIADEKYAVAIGGVIGGKNSEIIPSTREVIIESAYFDKVNIRRTSRFIGLSTESSYRFERGVSYQMVDWASKRAASLMCQFANGKVAKGVVDVSIEFEKPKPVLVRTKRAEKVLGIQLDEKRVEKILVAMQCQIIEKNRQNFVVLPPEFREDLKLEIDFIEEIARIVGYDKIPSDYDMGIFVPRRLHEDLVTQRVKDIMLKLGFCEVSTKSFITHPSAQLFSCWSKREPISLIDPRGKLKETLRKSIAPSFLEVVKVNEANWQTVDKIFEIANVYFKQNDNFLEKQILAILCSDFYSVKGALQKVFGELQIPAQFVQRDFEFLEEGRGAEIVVNSQKIGYAGVVNKQITGKFDLKSQPSVAEIDFGAITKLANLDKKFKELVRQPPVFRDVAIVVADDITWKQIEVVVKETSPEFLESITLFDIYRGPQIQSGKKSIAFSLVFRDAQRTLTGEEVNKVIEDIVLALKQKLGAYLR